MNNLPQQIYKFAQVISISHKSDIDKIFSENDFETKNSRHILNWDFIYRDIGNIAQLNDLTSPIMHMGTLWTARGVIIEGIFYIFMMQKRFEDITEKYEKHHYLTCLARSKNSHLNGKEKDTLSIDLFNDLDDDELSKSQIEQAKKLLGEHHDLITEVRIISFNRDTQEVRVNRVNSFCELVDAVNITEFDFTRLEKDSRENRPEKRLVELKTSIQKKLDFPKPFNMPKKDKISK